MQDDDDKEKAGDDGGESSTAGVLDQSGWLLDRSMMWQAYAMVRNCYHPLALLCP